MPRAPKTRAKPRPSSELTRDQTAILDRALDQHRKGELEPALEGYREILAAAPRNVDALYNLGAILAEQGRPNDAFEQLAKASSMAVNRPNTQNDIGICLVHIGRLEEAVVAFQRSVGMAPAFGTGWKNLAHVLIELAREEDAKAVAQRAVLVEPLLATAWFEVFRSVFDERSLAPAIDALTKAVTSKPDFAHARFCFGVVLDLAGDEKAAQAQFNAIHADKKVFAGAVDSWKYVKEKRTPATRSFISVKRTGLHALSEAKNQGLVLEFGVRHGISTRWMGDFLLAEGKGEVVHGFDSFEGLPEDWHVQPKGIYSTHGQVPPVPKNVEIHVGLFENVLPRFLADHRQPVRFAHLDADLYSATKTALVAIADRVVPGTVLLFDEYLFNDRWREDEYKAFQEIVTERGWKYEYIAMSVMTAQAAVRILAV